MHILFDHQAFQGQKYGGISRYYYELITRLMSEKDFEISLFQGLNVNRFPFEKYEKEYKHFISNNIRSIPRGERYLSILNHFFLSRFARRIKPDILHETYFGNPCPKMKMKRVLTVYDMIHEIYPDYFTSNNDATLNKRNAVDRVDKVISISHHTKKDLMDLFSVPESKIEVIHLASSLRPHPVPDTPIHPRPFLLHVGPRLRYKNFKTLLKAFAGSPKIYENFDLVNFGGPHWTGDEQEIFRKYGIENRVHLRGGGDEDLIQYYQAARAFVFPSMYEGFGIPVLEAMGLNCPVICANVSSLPEIGGDAALYFSPNDESELETCLLRLCLDDSFRYSLIEKGRRQQKGFSWSDATKRTAELYRSIL